MEIGGGVRIPEIVRRAGARLIEVGTTNRTRVADFEPPLAEGRARVVLRVHPSNFTMAGFTEAPDPEALAELAHRHGAIVVDDLGSGALLATEAFGLAHEPMPSERLAAGADIVTFSGDKLVGGPQAGLVVGRADLVARMRRDPLARAMRPDKATLAGVAATLGLYRAGRAVEAIPVWSMIAMPSAAIRARAETVAAALGGSPGRRGGRRWSRRSAVGRSRARRCRRSASRCAARSATRVLAALRRGSPPVIGRIADGRVILDLRTVDPIDDERLAVRDRPRARGARVTVVIGTAGHIDHGKTTLLRALTGIDADRLPEERRRGMTIDVGYAHLALPDGSELDFVDVPGHDRLIGNMLVGAGEIDAAMLVVAADDGPRAQTLEHLELLDALAIDLGVAVVTKVDLVDAGARGRGRRGRRPAAGGDVPARVAGRRRLVDRRHRGWTSFGRAPGSAARPRPGARSRGSACVRRAGRAWRSIGASPSRAAARS